MTEELGGAMRMATPFRFLYEETIPESTQELDGTVNSIIPDSMEPLESNVRAILHQPRVIMERRQR